MIFWKCVYQNSIIKKIGDANCIKISIFSYLGTEYRHQIALSEFKDCLNSFKTIILVLNIVKLQNVKDITILNLICPNPLLSQ